MHVAVFIENQETVGILTQLFEIYQEKHDVHLFCHYFENEIELLCNFVSGNFDVLFLGSKVSKHIVEEIREKDQRLRLVGVTPIGSNALGNEKLLWDRLPEPMDEFFLFPVLDRLFSEVYKNTELGMVIQSRGSIRHLIFSHIEYVEVMGKNVCFHLLEGITETIRGTISEYEVQLLKWPDFIKVHRAYIINLRHIDKLMLSGIITRSGHTVPVSKKLYPQFKRDYLCGLKVPMVNSETKPKVIFSVPEKTTIVYTILLLDDEESERLRWSKVLIDKGCIVHTAGCGEVALSLAVQNHFDCVVLDVRLGNDNGFDLCQELQAKTGAPVVFLSVLSDSENQTKGFVSGGIDYITKGVTSDLFWAKIETRIKISKTVTSELALGPLRLNLKLRKAYLQSQELSLTTVEFDILYWLMQNPGKVYTPERLYESIWGTRQPKDANTVSMHMSQLCLKLENVCPGGGFIEIAWGIGYCFIPKE